MKRDLPLLHAVLAAWVALPALAQSELPANRPADWTCFVTVKTNVVDLPDDSADGLLVLGAYVSTSSSCQSGEVYVGVYPQSDCFVKPQRDPKRPEPMQFTYEPRVLTIQVEPGNQAKGLLEIKTGNHGACSFNTHIASCGSVVPPGAKCETRKLDDPNAEGAGAVLREFNRIP